MTDTDRSDAFGFALGTFSNGPALPPVTMADVACAAYETNSFVFWSFSRYWFQYAGLRKWRELSAADQAAALASFRKLPPISETEGDFMQASFNGIRFPYAAVRFKPRPIFIIHGLGPVEILGAPYGNPPYRRCVCCGKAKRSRARRARRARPYCARCG